MLLPFFGLLILAGCSGNVEGEDVKNWQQSEDDKKAGIDSSKVENSQPDR